MCKDYVKGFSMNTKQKRYRNNLLAKIHAHRKYKELYEAGFWSEWLSIRYGVESSKYLSIKELWEVLDILSGIKPDRDYCLQDSVGRAMLLPLKKRHETQKITKNQALLIEELFNILRYDSVRQKAFFTKQIKREIRSLQELSKEEATKIITGLKRVIKWDGERLRYMNNRNYEGF